MLVESKKFVAFGVELLNVGSKIINKQGVFTMFQLSDEAMALGTLNVEALKAEWPVGSLKANVVELVASGKSKLELVNKEVQEKVSKAFDVASHGFSVIAEAVEVIGEAKALLS